jgi:UDP-N-acetylglucosamine 2-epimerase
MKKTVATITGIRPDFIRMSEIFKKLDLEFNHILIHTGQHYDKMLSGVFFDELNIRKPNYILNTGKSGGTHYHQLSYLSTAIIELFKNENIHPDIILFLGDSNTVCSALPLRKEGYIIGHIEAGMRSFDKRMLEEINRTTCDHSSHILFVYHEKYREFLEKENIKENVHVVGNTITEVANKFLPTEEKKRDLILIDVHRPENFKDIKRMKKIIQYANLCGKKYNLPVKMLKFYGTCKNLKEFQLDLGDIELIDLLSYKNYLNLVYHSKFLISDSGTAQEEPAFLKTKVIVPRDYTERPQSVESNCSFMLDVIYDNFEESFQWLESDEEIQTEWLGDGKTSEKIVDILKDFLFKIEITSELKKYPFPHLYQDNILELDFAKRLREEILNIPDKDWDRYNNPFEQKYTFRDKYNLPSNCEKLFTYLTSDKFVKQLSEIVEIKLINDPSRNFWGIHKYDDGDYLDIHVDAGLHPNTKQKKQLTLGIYLSSDGWNEENAGALEIWKGENSKNNDAKLIEKVNEFLPIFNRMIIFSCDDYSWHGNPNKINCKNGEKRIFLTLSYLSEKETYENKKVKAFFVPRPEDPYDEEKDKLRMLRCDPVKYKEIYSINKM